MRWILTSSLVNDVQIEYHQIRLGVRVAQGDENNVRLRIGDLFDITSAVNSDSLK